MSALKTSIYALWVFFWVYWLISATRAKTGSRTRRTRPPGLFVAILAVVVLRLIRPGSLAVHAPALQALGAVLLLAGLGLAVWARIHLGRNWGMPMSRKDEPELVTSGPYRLVRHPIYSGILLAMLGTSLATNGYWLVVLGFTGAYFLYSAKVEEQLMVSIFPAAYPSYRAHTKMLIPYLL